MLPFLLDSTYAEKEPHQTLYWRSAYHKGIRKENWKLIQDDLAERTVLYHISSDKYEQKDLSKEKPLILKRLQEDFKNWEANLISPKWPRVMDYEIHEGEEVFYFPL